jgi:branched-chain amino acid transport system ATP-binding protein/neutral amino acid transport system ATP-binding protein
MLRVEGVGKSFGGIAALRDVHLEAPERRITGIIGPNGAGKSTLLNIIGGLFKPDSGRVILADQDISHLPLHMRARAGLVRTFQISRELGELTVIENLLLARPRQIGEFVWSAFLRYPAVRREESDAIVRARSILERVGLTRVIDAPARSLSGGQKKLLELCRALMLAPKIILLDEPAAGVSPPMRAEIAKIIKALRAEGLSFVIVEHDMDMVSNLCDHVYVMAEGANLTYGTFGQVMAEKRVVRAYLGGLE